MIKVKQISDIIKTNKDKILNRDRQLDYIKGSCVLIMLLYHVMSMAASYYDVEPFLMRLNFIHASFLFISGWLVGSYYAAKVNNGQTVLVYRRLLFRGLKLCCLFLVINILCYALGIGYSFTNLSTVGSVGEVLRILFLQPRGDLMAGEILWEIGLFLTLIAPIIALQKIWLFYPISIILWIAGLWEAIPFFINIGTLGIIAGWHVRNRDYGKVLQNKVVMFSCISIWLLYLIYVLPLSQICRMIPQLAVVISIAEIVLWFAMFIILFQYKILPFSEKYFNFWANYTLVAYCSQLVIARVIILVFHPKNFVSYFCVALVLNILLMHWVLRAIDSARRKSWIVNSSYKLVFA